MDDSSFESFGDFGDFQSADGDADFGPFESGGSTFNSGDASHDQPSSNASGTTSSGKQKDVGDDDDDVSLTLTPTSGSWTIASGNDGFEEIRRVDRERGV